MELNIDDIKLKTFANLSYTYKGIKIKPKSIEDIINHSYDLFNQKLSLVALNVNDVFPGIDDPEILELPLFEILVELNNIDFLISYKEAFEFFLNELIFILSDTRQLKVGEKVIEYSDLGIISKIIRIQNNVVKIGEDNEFKPLNERARKLQEKILKRRKKLEELKSKDDNGEHLTFLDLVSILASSGNGINIFNVCQLNYYQFNDQFNRIVMIDKYQTDIQALLHGADSKNIKLKHWISKME